jgi:hypothetical protein
MSDTRKKPSCLLEIILVGILSAAALLAAGAILLDPFINQLFGTLYRW